MIIELKVPTPGESISEVELASWSVKDGDLVSKNQELAEIESDKASLSLVATESGKIHLLVEAGSTVKVNSIACTIDTSFPVDNEANKVVIAKESPRIETIEPKKSVPSQPSNGVDLENVKVSPVAKVMMEENGLSVEDVLNGLRRLSKEDVERVLDSRNSSVSTSKNRNSRDESRVKMSQLRKKLSTRLVAVKNETAMLTTFNEVDVSKVRDLRARYGAEFEKKHGVKLGFMSFFIKASALALKQYSIVNSMVEGDEIITPDYVDIAVAVQTPKGLMVPVLRNVENLSLAEIENELKNLALKAREGKISLAEMMGGTFTVTNGGVFGSMLSTPIINPPQSAILGMHNIVDRPVVVGGQVVIRPIMYLALSYDHRIIDGKDSVGCLYRIKEIIENPYFLLTEGKDTDRAILNL